MQSELRSLSKIFSESIFRIPDYQRGYSWREKQLKEFWSDLDQLADGRTHYTGVLTLEPVGRSDYSRWDDDLWIIEAKRYVPLYVVDGQQRLTTAIILLQAILERIDNKIQLNYTSSDDIRKKFIYETKKNGGLSKSYIFGYEKDNPSYEFLKRNVFLDHSDEHSTAEETIYTSNLEFAKKFFSGRLSAMSDNQVEEIYTKLTQHLLFNIFTIEPELDVFVTFETMNNRGKPLSHLELLKNRLIYLSTKFDSEKSEKERLRKTVNESFKTVYHYLGKTQGRILDDDIFLRTHFLSYFGPTLKRAEAEEIDADEYDFRRYIRADSYKDYLLESVFSPKRLHSSAEDKLTIQDVYAYAQDIKSSVETYYQIFKPADSNFTDTEKIFLHRINRLDFFPGRLLVLASMKCVPEPEKRERLFETLERFIFLMRFKMYHFTDTKIDHMAVALKAGDLTADEISRKLTNTIDAFVKTADFKDAIASIGKGGGYYTWSPLRYFMYEYEQWLKSQARTERDRLDWTEFSKEDFDSDHKTIEHIYPQKAKSASWKTPFDAYLIKERNTLRNSLGNLLPLSQPKNSSLGNKDFEEKKGSAENKAGYYYGCYSEIEVSREQSWTPLHILRRGIRLLDFMEQRWRVPLGDDSRKAEILGLKFVLSREGLDASALMQRPQSPFVISDGDD
ncbi:DUF262 domain-containing protein [Burkholderia gladioli]|uniref:DUF262 domain-containing protein n=1 Tax=Burkholderia gladioli TaxID=28095 RepID=UPI00163E9F91|nr:DUF262 domain-containing protein [Burkholderia gladioli]